MSIASGVKHDSTLILVVDGRCLMTASLDEVLQQLAEREKERIMSRKGTEATSTPFTAAVLFPTIEFEGGTCLRTATWHQLQKGLLEAHRRRKTHNPELRLYRVSGSPPAPVDAEFVVIARVCNRSRNQWCKSATTVRDSQYCCLPQHTDIQILRMEAFNHPDEVV